MGDSSGNMFGTQLTHWPYLCGLELLVCQSVWAVLWLTNRWRRETRHRRIGIKLQYLHLETRATFFSDSEPFTPWRSLLCASCLSFRDILTRAVGTVWTVFEHQEYVCIWISVANSIIRARQTGVPKLFDSLVDFFRSTHEFSKPKSHKWDRVSEAWRNKRKWSCQARCLRCLVTWAQRWSATLLGK